VRRWLSYAAAGLLLTLAAALVTAALVRDEGRAGVWFAAGLAYLLQLAAFGVLLAVRDDPQHFLVGWAGGILLRFGALGAVAFWLGRRPVLPRAETLLSLVGFMMLLLLLEPVFLNARRGRGAARAAVGGVNEGAN